MRFDVGRAMELAELFAVERFSGTEGEHRAANLIAGLFEQSRLTVTRTRVVGSPLLLAARFVGWVHCGAALGLAALSLVSRTYSGWAWFLIPYGLAFGLWFPPLFVRIPRLRKSDRETENVEGLRPASAGAPVRVVFVTAHDTPSAVLPGWPLRLATAGVLLGLTALTFLIYQRATRPGAATPFPWAGETLAFGLMLTFIWWATLRSKWFRGKGPLDNRDGVAALVEMARAWSPNADSRVETRFVAAGGQILDGAGYRSLIHQIREVWPAKPTLIVGLWSPGVGSEVTVVSPRLGPLAWEAAAGLWVPHRPALIPFFTRDFWPDRGVDPDLIALFGRPDRGVEPVVQPEALRRIAQLATEITLRWARQTTESIQATENARTA